jgi:hypothetical protein
MAIETPKYNLLNKDKNVELREYLGYIKATVKVEGSSHNDAGNTAFTILASYIFGNNIGETTIGMSSPVLSQHNNSSVKMPMTAPVIIKSIMSLNYEVSFMMPSEYTIKSIPKPVDKAIKLSKIEKHQAVAFMFSGITSEKKLSKITTLLRIWIKDHGLTQTTEPVLARYDPPWKPALCAATKLLSASNKCTNSL